MGVKLCLST